MRYVERNLRNNEHVVATAHVSYWSIVPIILRTVLCCGVIFAALYFGSDYSIKENYVQYNSELYQTITNVKPILLIIAIVVAVVMAAIPIIKLLCIQMVVTDKKLIGKYGVIYVHALDTYLEKIDNFTIEETVLGRIFRYNTITVGTTSNTMKFKYIANARAFKNKVMDCYDARLEDLMGRQADLVHLSFKSDDKKPIGELNTGGYGIPEGEDVLGGFSLSDTPADTQDIVAEVQVPDTPEVPEIPEVQEESEDADIAEELQDEVDIIEADEEPIIPEEPEDTADDLPEEAADDLPEETADEDAPVQDPLYFKDVPVDFITEDFENDSEVSDESDLDDILNFREVTDDFGFEDEPYDEK